MDLFDRARAVRLRSTHDKYLLADEDEEHVRQDRNGASRNARWTVEYIDGITHVLRFKSCYGKYLTASNEKFLLGATGLKVLQTLPKRLDSSLEWEPIREGFLLKLKTRYGNYLRANGGLPPWRNSVTHDVPSRTATQDWILWHVDIVDVQVIAPAPAVAEEPGSPTLESTPSFSEPIHIVEGRSIYYKVAEDDGTLDDSTEWPHLTFIGTSVPELTERLKELTELDDIIICTKNPFNHNLSPLLLGLPPNTTMRLVVVDANSTVGHRLQGDVDKLQN